jgi:hypothetical protein
MPPGLCGTRFDESSNLLSAVFFSIFLFSDLHDLGAGQVNLSSRYGLLCVIHIIDKRPVVVWLEGQVQSPVEPLCRNHLNQVASLAEQIRQSSMNTLEFLRNLVAGYLITVFHAVIDRLSGGLTEHEQTMVNGFEQQLAELAGTRF